MSNHYEIALRFERYAADIERQLPAEYFQKLKDAGYSQANLAVDALFEHGDASEALGWYLHEPRKFRSLLEQCSPKVLSLLYFLRLANHLMWAFDQLATDELDDSQALGMLFDRNKTVFDKFRVFLSDMGFDS